MANNIIQRQFFTTDLQCHVFIQMYKEQAAILITANLDPASTFFFIAMYTQYWYIFALV